MGIISKQIKERLPFNRNFDIIHCMAFPPEFSWHFDGVVLQYIRPFNIYLDISTMKVEKMMKYGKSFLNNRFTATSIHKWSNPVVYTTKRHCNTSKNKQLTF